MNRTLFKTVVTLIILIILLVLFLKFLNVKLSGVPIYDKMKIDRNQLVYVKSKSSKINKEFIPKTENFNSNNQLLVKCGYQENGIYHLVYKPDIYGFRENHEKLYKNTEIVLIGDSFAFSSCINKPHDLKSQLKKISKKKVLNLSQGGTGPLRQTIIVKEFTKKTNFDYFVWIFYEGNDFNDIIYEKNKERKLRSKIKMVKTGSLTSIYKGIKKNISEKEKLINEVLDNEIFKSKEDIIVNYNKFIKLNKKFPEVKMLETKWQNEKLVNIKIFFAERLRGLSSLIKYFKNYPKILSNKEYDLIVNEMNNYLNKKNIKKKYIYYLPKYTRLTHNNYSHPEVENLNQIKNIVKQTAKKYNFEFIDGANFFHKRKIPLDIFPNKLPTHFNENGLKLTAEHINNFIFHNKN